MKNIVSATLATAALAIAAPAMADAHMEKNDRADWKAETPEVVERNSRGQATKVRIGENVYDVCMREGQDSCIQPRAAGLNWGPRPLTYWPGRPASSM